ncbi:hypothetical protein PCORN_17509 [Listeria cornellensis FSL F6-0969]|uniref:Uncharacterized protein n=1 Tax=Listeria cornellensis FSL F6-0969 TaxID=1265820 RepID=W7BE21_9LIST|nr:hypothetical protein PCORN_17509 [Listeria cornellensis FSL F6-0969]
MIKNRNIFLKLLFFISVLVLICMPREEVQAAAMVNQDNPPNAIKLDNLFTVPSGQSSSVVQKKRL